MRPQAHVAASLVVWSAGSGAAWEAPVCVLCGNLPDLDRSVARRLGVIRRDHHRWVSHSLAGWLPPSLMALAASRHTRAAGPVQRGVASLWIHLLLDTYADGIAWAWPLHEEKIGCFRRPAEIEDDGWNTPAPLGTNLGRAEAAMWAALVLDRLRRRTT